MNFRKTCICAFALLGVSSTANAAITNLGAITPGPPTPFSGAVLPAGPFVDTFTFNLPTNGGSGYSVVNFPLSIPGIGTFSTLFSSLALVSDPDGTPYNLDDVLLSSVASSPASNSLNMSWGPSVGGNMYLIVSGVANGTIGGLYSGGISVEPPAVPVPATLWLLGSAVAGLVATRKNRQEA